MYPRKAQNSLKANLKKTPSNKDPEHVDDQEPQKSEYKASEGQTEVPEQPVASQTRSPITVEEESKNHHP